MRFLIAILILPSCGEAVLTVHNEGPSHSEVVKIWETVAESQGWPLMLPDSLEVYFYGCPYPGFRHAAGCFHEEWGQPDRIFAKDGRCRILYHEFVHYGQHNYLDVVDPDHRRSEWDISRWLIVNECEG